MAISVNNSSQSMWNVISLASKLKYTFSSMEKLSSGLSINSAADDPAGLVISEQFRTQTASLSQELSNVTNLINKYSTASSTVSTLRSQLTNLKTLAVGASNEAVNGEAAQQAYDDAAASLVASYNQIADSAQYNGSQLLDGSEGSLAEVADLTGVDLSSAASAAASVEVLDEAIEAIDQVQVDLGATQKNELESQSRSLQVTRQNLIAAESAVRDTDFASEFSKLIAGQITAQATMSMMSHQFEMSRSLVELLRPSTGVYSTYG